MSLLCSWQNTEDRSEELIKILLLSVIAALTAVKLYEKQTFFASPLLQLLHVLT